MWFGLVSALLAALCYGTASPMQAAAARATADRRTGVDPALLVRLLGQWRYLCGVGLDMLGFAFAVIALRSLPLFLVQAAQAASLAVTALLTVRWFGGRLSRPEWTAVGMMCLGLALLGLSARSQGARSTGLAFHFGLLIVVLLLAVAGLLAGRLAAGPRTAVLGLIGGLGFGALGIASRIIPSFTLSTLLADPATYVIVVAGVMGSLFYASALQRGAVVAAAAMMVVGETVVPSVLGVLLLGDRSRPGWAPVAIAGFAIAIMGALTLARFGEVTEDELAEPDTVGVSG